MRIDITDKILKAINQGQDWNISIFYAVVGQLKLNEFEISFWEGDENWASILKDDVVLGYIWKKYPLITIQSSYATKIKDILKNIKRIEYLVTKSLKKEYFKIDFEYLKDYLDYFENYKSFSIEDLWFYTNSN